jgi:hypothetical protein
MSLVENFDWVVICSKDILQRLCQEQGSAIVSMNHIRAGLAFETVLYPFKPSSSNTPSEQSFKQHIVKSQNAKTSRQTVYCDDHYTI